MSEEAMYALELVLAGVVIGAWIVVGLFLLFMALS